MSSVWIEVAGADEDVKLFLDFLRTMVPEIDSEPTIQSYGISGRRMHTIRFRAPESSGLKEDQVTVWLKQCFLPRSKVRIMP